MKMHSLEPAKLSYGQRFETSDTDHGKTTRLFIRVFKSNWSDAPNPAVMELEILHPDLSVEYNLDEDNARMLFNALAARLGHAITASAPLISVTLPQEDSHVSQPQHTEV